MRKIAANESSFVYILGLCGGSILGTVLFNLIPTAGIYKGVNWLSFLIPQIAFLLVVFGYSRLRRVDIKSVAKVRKPFNYKQFLLLPLISVATIILFLPISNLFGKLLTVMGFNGQTASVPQGDVGVYFIALLIMGLLPAIGEEFMMRGVLFSGLSTRNTWFGILISSLLFSLMHQNPLQTVHQFGLGIVLCIVLLSSGSIWCCVLVHFINNFISLTIMTFIPQIDAAYISLGNMSYLTDFAAIIIGFILLVCLLYLFYRLGKPEKDKYRSATDGLVFDEFTIYATPEVKSENRKKRFETSMFADVFKFFASIFTKRGLNNVTAELRYLNDSPYIGKAQPMFNVWLAIGFGAFYWLVILILGFV